MRFIPDLLRTLTKQTFQDFTVLLIDNGSTDGIEAFIKKEYPQIAFLRNARNLGFCGAHNQGIRYVLEHWKMEDWHDRFILITNPDIILTPTFLEGLMKEVDLYPSVGAFGGKLRRAFGEQVEDEVSRETIQSDLIDSTGLRTHKNYSFTDRGAGEMDTGQYDQQREVFGLSGALVLYRASALADVRYQEEIFDHDFFAYKEDVDLAWRLQQAGWSARYVPEALAFHYRGMYGKEQSGFFARIKNRYAKSRIRSYYSNRNQWLLLIKNLRLLNAFIASPRIFCLEFCRLLYTVFFETKNLRGFWDATSLLPRMIKKRLHAKKHRRRSAKELRQWFS